MPSNGNEWRIQVKYFDGSRPRLEVGPWRILVYLPKGVDEGEAFKIIDRHWKWIEKKHRELLKALEKAKNIELIERSRAEFKRLVKKLVEQAMKDIAGVSTCCRIIIRKMKTQWTSCSPRETITINALARHLPNHLVSYIVYHEICHVIEPKHDEAFWACIERYYPNHKEVEEELLAYELKLGLLTPIETPPR